MKAEIVPPYLTILATSAALPEGASQTHLFLKAVALSPTPGWSFHTDSIEIIENTYRFIIKLTEVAPQQLMAVDLTPHLLSINLGRPSVGLHLVEIHARSSSDKPYTLRQAFVMRVDANEEGFLQQRQGNMADFCGTPEQEDDGRQPKKQEKEEG